MTAARARRASVSHDLPPPRRYIALSRIDGHLRWSTRIRSACHPSARPPRSDSAVRCACNWDARLRARCSRQHPTPRCHPTPPICHRKHGDAARACHAWGGLTQAGRVSLDVNRLQICSCHLGGTRLSGHTTHVGRTHSTMTLAVVSLLLCAAGGGTVCVQSLGYTHRSSRASGFVHTSHVRTCATPPDCCLVAAHCRRHARCTYRLQPQGCSSSLGSAPAASSTHTAQPAVSTSPPPSPSALATLLPPHTIFAI